MKKILSLLLLALCLCSRAATPTFQSFDLDQFDTNGYKITIKPLARLTNIVLYGGVVLTNIPGTGPFVAFDSLGHAYFTNITATSLSTFNTNQFSTNTDVALKSGAMVTNLNLSGGWVLFVQPGSNTLIVSNIMNSAQVLKFLTNNTIVMNGYLGIGTDVVTAALSIRQPIGFLDDLVLITDTNGNRPFRIQPDGIVSANLPGSGSMVAIDGGGDLFKTNGFSLESLSTSNATSRPLTNSNVAGLVKLYGLEGGAGVQLSDNGSNIVITTTTTTISITTNGVSVTASPTNLNFVSSLNMTNLSTNESGNVSINYVLANTLTLSNVFLKTLPGTGDFVAIDSGGSPFRTNLPAAAVVTVSSNGTIISTSLTNLNFVQGSDLIVLGTNASGNVSVEFRFKTNSAMQALTLTNALAFALATNNPTSSLTNFVADFNVPYTDIFATNDLNFLQSTSRVDGLFKFSVSMIIAGPTNRQIWLNTNWIVLGSGTNKFLLGSNRVAVLSLGQTGSQETNVWAVITTNAVPAGQ